jgi:hypothetical protein
MRKINLSGTATFRATDTFAANDLCRSSSVVDRSRAFASPTGNLLDDRQLGLAHVVDCRHTWTIYPQEPHGNGAAECWSDRAMKKVDLPRFCGHRYAAIGTAAICSGVLYPIAE